MSTTKDETSVTRFEDEEANYYADINTKRNDLERINTHGSVRLRHAETNEIVLVPQPSSDPNDPLNWSKGYRMYQAVLVCMAMVMCNWLAAGACYNSHISMQGRNIDRLQDRRWP